MVLIDTFGDELLDPERHAALVSVDLRDAIDLLLAHGYTVHDNDGQVVG